MTPAAEKCINLTLTYEGGLVDDPRDPGGLTNFGISLNRHPDLGSDWIRNCTRDQAVQWYYEKVWPGIRGDDLPLPVAMVTFDAAVNSGIHKAAQWLQEALGVTADGWIGPATIGACKAADVAGTVKYFSRRRLDFLMALSDFYTFGKGWTRRVNEVEAAALAAIGA